MLLYKKTKVTVKTNPLNKRKMVGSDRINRSSWGRRVGNMRSVIGNTMEGRINWASWAVAGTLAYFLWIKPSQQLKQEQEEKAAAAAAAVASDPYRYVEKRRPIPDPQVTGLVYGNKNISNKSPE